MTACVAARSRKWNHSRLGLSVGVDDIRAGGEEGESNPHDRRLAGQSHPHLHQHPTTTSDIYVALASIRRNARNRYPVIQAHTCNPSTVDEAPCPRPLSSCEALPTFAQWFAKTGGTT
ncbi:hypothetical protein EX30DRAFT_252067 [Ascodesmis nigricans]|uniref:Uncharacterized protein n=1 Tax=Ascodesmis nigricans TaxID=341454 RepID=A0A4S2MYJ9_9PEZI|nr:hypothetical protein EX30DRAFT_252067 [Ascodesmis nigricans]